MSTTKKAYLWMGIGILIDVIPPLIAVLTYFPFWVRRSSTATVSGVAILLAALCLVPFFRQIEQFLKTPSAPKMWGILLVIFLVTRAIAEEMVVVCAVGTVSNILGAFAYKYGKRLKAGVIDGQRDA